MNWRFWDLRSILFCSTRGCTTNSNQVFFQVSKCKWISIAWNLLRRRVLNLVLLNIYLIPISLSRRWFSSTSIQLLGFSDLSRMCRRCCVELFHNTTAPWLKRKFKMLCESHESHESGKTSSHAVCKMPAVVIASWEEGRNLPFFQFSLACLLVLS